METDQLTGKLVVLKPLNQSYINAYLAAFSPMVRLQVQADSLEAERAYLQDRLERQQHEEDTLFYCVFNRVTNQLIGALELRNRYTSRGQLYCWLHEHYWGGGFFQEALALASRAYFIKSGNLFFNAHVDKTNKRSYYALKKGGFADSGIVRGPCGLQYELILRRK
ncbi:MAG: GNAT family N-acetyltransferase [bacterium]|nr:GNAT family N-acetyltransferase [bacterium]